MPRVLAVAYDVGPASPAQPRVAALLREFVRRGAEVWLWTERDPGPWAAELAAHGRFRAVVVADPVARGYAHLLRRSRSPTVASAGTAAPRSPSSAGGITAWAWRLGARLLFTRSANAHCFGTVEDDFTHIDYLSTKQWAEAPCPCSGYCGRKEPTTDGQRQNRPE